ncbi:mitochondrial carrier [Lentinula aciculospora]|uniref:Mitochondrial carrier n=1 Tax=Lentinula aciculospora TaxID=153920 RepID=A0A9W9ALV9_9AGAR|nr:mitochondrial carrier [Lentinula aciculospora]
MAGDGVLDGNHIRIVGAVAGIGSGTISSNRLLDSVAEFSRVLPGLTKVTVGHGSAYTWFDTIKTRLQCSPGIYRGAFDALFTIIRNEGPLALYKGATPPAVGWAAIDSLLLGSLHNYRLFLIRNGMTEPTPGSGTPRLTMVGHGLAGVAAGVTSTIIATPIEHIKVKLQLQSQRLISDRQFKGPIDCVRQILGVQGPLGLWSGFTGSVAFRLNFGFMFLSFESLMRASSTLNGTPFEMSTGTANFISGGLGSFVFWIFAMPADNIKNRMMSYPHPLPYPTGSVELSPSFWATAKSIHSQHGLPGFFRGLGPCFLRAFPVNASAFFVYEGLLRVLGAEKTRHS